MEGFGFDNILGDNEIENLFDTTEETPKEEAEESSEELENKEEKENITEEINPETLFEEEKPESVGNGNDNKEVKEKEGTESVQDAGISLNNDFYSSIASACAEEGIFPDLDEETIKKVESAEDFRDLIESQIKAGLDEKQKRIDDALNNGVEPTDIKKYENTLNYLATITDANIAEESERGEQLRRNIIFQDFLNRGYSQAKAEKYTKRTIDAGTDIEDAKEALQSNKDYFQEEYDKLLKNAQEEAEEVAEERKAQILELKDSLLKDKQLFGDIEVDNATRKKTFDNISKPIYKDPDTGEYYTALQKYEMEHKQDFLKYVGLAFTLTNGFKDFEGFTKGKVKKEVKKGLRELENTLRNTKRDFSGNLNLVTSAHEDNNSFIGKGLRLDI